jgi:hypothetical protein
MPALDKSLPKVAQTLLKTFGRTLLFTENRTGTFQPSTNTSPTTVIEHEVKAVITNYRENDRAGVRTGDKRVILAAKDVDVAPSTEWRFKIDTRNYEVIDVTTIYSGELPALYELMARGS